ncbi:MAG: hypothetical protein ISS35_06475 [Kiritimatiellae bacterium]|nr:hypothetical protein [Kiritimatiellia bacterium]
MKALNTIIITTLTGILLTGTTGCRRAETYGTVDPQASEASVAELLAGATRVTSRTIRVKGQITRECPTGCWFELEDDGNSIHVDLSGAGIAIPQRVGKQVTVIGTLEKKGPMAQVAATGVTLP